MEIIRGVKVMIKKCNATILNASDPMYKTQKERVHILNEKFFKNINLTDKENIVLTWICSWDNRIFDATVSVLEKVRDESNS